jgi:NADPH:quinone reductase-like Zn-dependent oxidoreductase
VLVRVRAAAVLAGDWHVVRGSPFFIRFAIGLRRPRNLVPGMDLAGVVEGLGPGVEGELGRPSDQLIRGHAHQFRERPAAKAGSRASPGSSQPY